jgi:hypothetical protein
MKNDLSAISGGSPCEDALIRSVVNFDINPTLYCTKPEFTKYALAYIDKIYELKSDVLSDEDEIDLIKSLRL